MPSNPRQPERFRFFILTCRDPKSDFRRPLVDALRNHSETWYIWLRRRPIVSGPSANDAPVEMSLRSLVLFFRRFRQDGTVNVYLNSTNTYFPGLTVLLRLTAPAGVWCLDMHDDLRYHNKGFKLWREEKIISLLRRLSHVTVHAAATLQELFPDSRHLGNASHILPLPKGNQPEDAILVIASFDERFDFDFMSELARACPATRFHLHGRTRPDDTPTMVQITAIGARHANVRYLGPYTTETLPGILASYRVSVAPYRTDTVLTRYIDPLRFYHCLNAGLEVVSTDIPQARQMRDWIHIVSDVTSCVDTLAAIQSGAATKQPAYAPITWGQRADRLIEIIRTTSRTNRPRGKRPAH